MSNQAYHPKGFHLNFDSFITMREADSILMCNPEFFDIIDIKNTFMENFDGQLNKVQAIRQWENIKNHYSRFSEDNTIKELSIIPGAEGLEDMVFCANQTFPFLMPDNQKVFVVSKMRYPSRQLEVPYFTEWFIQKGYEAIHLEKTDLFEGMGDTIPHPGRRLLYGGYGHRSNFEAYEEIAQKLDVPILTLKLVHPDFYHLDTCFIPLSDEALILCPDAFDTASLDCLKQLFKRVYEIPIDTAKKGFGLNAHTLRSSNGKKIALIQNNNPEINAVLRIEGYEIYECPTSEFMKSGGSVFCMKMGYWG